MITISFEIEEGNAAAILNKIGIETGKSTDRRILGKTVPGQWYAINPANGRYINLTEAFSAIFTQRVDNAPFPTREEAIKALDKIPFKLTPHVN